MYPSVLLSLQKYRGAFLLRVSQWLTSGIWRLIFGRMPDAMLQVLPTTAPIIQTYDAAIGNSSSSKTRVPYNGSKHSYNMIIRERRKIKVLRFHKIEIHNVFFVLCIDLHLEETRYHKEGCMSYRSSFMTMCPFQSSQRWIHC